MWRADGRRGVLTAGAGRSCRAGWTGGRGQARPAELAGRPAAALTPGGALAAGVRCLLTFLQRKDKLLWLWVSVSANVFPSPPPAPGAV